VTALESRLHDGLDTGEDMSKKRLLYEFSELKRAFPDAKITDDGRFLYIPELALPPKYNMSSTPVLISLTKDYEDWLYEVPATYVSSGLRLKHGRSSALEAPTPPELRAAGWGKLCWRNPPDVARLREFVASLIMFFEELEEQ